MQRCNLAPACLRRQQIPYLQAHMPASGPKQDDLAEIKEMAQKATFPHKTRYRSDLQYRTCCHKTSLYRP